MTLPIETIINKFDQPDLCKFNIYNFDDSLVHSDTFCTIECIASSQSSLNEYSKFIN